MILSCNAFCVFSVALWKAERTDVKASGQRNKKIVEEREERSVNTEVGFGRGRFSFATTSYDCIGDLVTVLWLSRPERRGWRGGGRGGGVGLALAQTGRQRDGPTNGQIWRLPGYIHVS